MGGAHAVICRAFNPFGRLICLWPHHNRAAERAPPRLTPTGGVAVRASLHWRRAPAVGVGVGEAIHGASE